eukprot:Platyproteum_vivax@DN514_c0_g1_i1.p1
MSINLLSGIEARYLIHTLVFLDHTDFLILQECSVTSRDILRDMEEDFFEMLYYKTFYRMCSSIKTPDCTWVETYQTLVKWDRIRVLVTTINNNTAKKVSIHIPDTEAEYNPPPPQDVDPEFEARFEKMFLATVFERQDNEHSDEDKKGGKHYCPTRRFYDQEENEVFYTPQGRSAKYKENT